MAKSGIWEIPLKIASMLGLDGESKAVALEETVGEERQLQASMGWDRRSSERPPTPATGSTHEKEENAIKRKGINRGFHFVMSDSARDGSRPVILRPRVGRGSALGNQLASGGRGGPCLPRARKGLVQSGGDQPPDRPGLWLQQDCFGLGRRESELRLRGHLGHHPHSDEGARAQEILMATKKKVTVEVNGQQYRLIQQLREKGTYRNTDTGVIVKGFREWGEKKLVERPS